MFFLGLNGPPGSGKDHFAKLLLSSSEVRKHFKMFHLKFAEPLKDAVHALYGGTYSEDRKDKPSFVGPTWRELYISMSEDHAKKMGGPEIFGRLLCQKMVFLLEDYLGEKPLLFIVSDCGFDREQFPVINLLPMTSRLWVRLHREGKDFTGDSRSYLDLGGSAWEMDFQNSGDQLAEEMFVHEFFRWAKELGWMS